MALTVQNSRSRSSLNRQGPPVEMTTTPKTKTMTNSLSRRGVQSERFSSASEDRLSLSGRGLQSERFASDSEDSPKQDKKTFISAVSKIKTKQMKGLITGMGKELRRAATSVGERLPNPTKKKNKEERERQELLEAPRPQARNPDEIKKAYGHTVDVRQAASVTHGKLSERGEKLSAIQDKTTELEADAANFSSLVQELVKKEENRKWYAI